MIKLKIILKFIMVLQVVAQQLMDIHIFLLNKSTKLYILNSNFFKYLLGLLTFNVKILRRSYLKWV